MADQKNDESIEEIEREQLFKLIETKEFLAVVWCEYGEIRKFVKLFENSIFNAI